MNRVIVSLGLVGLMGISSVANATDLSDNLKSRITRMMIAQLNLVKVALDEQNLPSIRWQNGTVSCYATRTYESCDDGSESTTTYSEPTNTTCFTMHRRLLPDWKACW